MMLRVPPLLAAARKAVMGQLAGLAGGPVGSAVYYLLANRRRRKVLIAASMIIVALVLATVSAAIQQPMYIANVITHKLFGNDSSGGNNWEDVPGPDICTAPPSSATPVVAPSTTTAPYPGEVSIVDEGGDEGETGAQLSTSEAPPLPPPPALGPDGKVTAVARKIMDAIPPKSDMTVAQTYILYRLAHPESPFPENWDAWKRAFYAATSTLSSNPSALDVATTMDNGADYRPYLLVSDAATYRLLKNSKVSGDARRVSMLLLSMGQLCRNGSGNSPVGTGHP